MAKWKIRRFFASAPRFQFSFFSPFTPRFSFTRWPILTLTREVPPQFVHLFVPPEPALSATAGSERCAMTACASRDGAVPGAVTPRSADSLKNLSSLFRTLPATRSSPHLTAERKHRAAQPVRPTLRARPPPPRPQLSAGPMHSAGALWAQARRFRGRAGAARRRRVSALPLARRPRCCRSGGRGRPGLPLPVWCHGGPCALMAAGS